MGLLQNINGNGGLTELVVRLCSSLIGINLALMAFNLLPIPPLDGSKVIQPFIPLRYEMTYLEYLRRGPMLLLGLLLAEFLFHIPILGTWVFGIMGPVLNLMNTVGHLFT
jgi:Zn-dependent protease